MVLSGGGTEGNAAVLPRIVYFVSVAVLLLCCAIIIRAQVKCSASICKHVVVVGKGRRMYVEGKQSTAEASAIQPSDGCSVSILVLDV